MAFRALSTSSSTSASTSQTNTSYSTSPSSPTIKSKDASLLQTLHPLPPPDSSSLSPRYSLGDLVFMVGEGDSSRELCEIVDVGFKASEGAYVYDVVPRYNPGLRGLFLCRDRDLRKSCWTVGEEIRLGSEGGTGGRGDSGRGDGVGIRVKILEVRYWNGSFLYRVGRSQEWNGREKSRGKQSLFDGGAVESLLEEQELVKMVWVKDIQVQKGKENHTP